MTTHNDKTPDEPMIAEFKTGLGGALIRPGDSGYDTARKIHNAMIDRRPDFIVRCAGVADVIAAVNFARSHRLLVAIRGTGHNVAGTSLCDGGLVIDLSLMKSVRIDPVARTARVEGGASWGELNHDLQAFGLAVTGGFISTTGVSGLTLGGGLGWLVRKHGFSQQIRVDEAQFRQQREEAAVAELIRRLEEHDRKEGRRCDIAR
jgi:FAD/FMN-containing dehydrogenase